MPLIEPRARPAPRHALPVGALFYNGPSLLNGEPIAAVATCLMRHSQNPKTGDMIQTYILPVGVDPVTATKTGADSSVCGDCPLRPASGGACYVVVHKAPQQVWRSLRNSLYPTVTPQRLGAMLRGLLVRMGAWGDPAAVPYEAWESLLRHTSGHTGYTHKWRTCDPRFANMVMASCDNIEDHREAKEAGWRAFLVTAGDIGPPEGRFVLCPASERAGRLLTCSECLHCSGNASGRVSDVWIPAHGFRAKRFVGI